MELCVRWKKLKLDSETNLGLTNNATSHSNACAKQIVKMLPNHKSYGFAAIKTLQMVHFLLLFYRNPLARKHFATR